MKPMDEAAVNDSLQCLYGMTEASKEARQVAIEADAFTATASALQLSGEPQHWAVRLLVNLLESRVDMRVALQGIY